ncbi:MAG TPA: nitroreductase family protein [Mesotoga infera]|nr:nitroreductase family protein [Mesotoga infera]
MYDRQEIARAIELRITQRKFENRRLKEHEEASVRDSLKGLEHLERSGPLQWYYSQNFPIASGIVLAKMNDFSTEKLVEYGFEGEQIVLNLTLKGFSTSWARLPNYLSMIILGYPEKNEIVNVERAARKLYRNSNRKPLEELIIGRTELLDPDMREILLSGRLAPSSFNRQPWTFEILDEREIAIHGWKKLPVIYEEVISIDLGVVLSHVYLMARAIKSGVTLERKSTRTYLLRWS